MHQIQCIQSSIPNAAPIGAETASLAPSGLLGSAKQCETVLTEIGKNFADRENAGTARDLMVTYCRTFLRPAAHCEAQEEQSRPSVQDTRRRVCRKRSLEACSKAIETGGHCREN